MHDGGGGKNTKKKKKTKCTKERAPDAESESSSGSQSGPTETLMCEVQVRPVEGITTSFNPYPDFADFVQNGE